MHSQDYWAVVIPAAGNNRSGSRFFTQHENHVAIWEANYSSDKAAAEASAAMLKLNGINARVARVNVTEVDEATPIEE